MCSSNLLTLIPRYVAIAVATCAVAPAFAAEVNCTAGETIADALHGRAKSIVIKGVCTEDVTLDKDGIALISDDGDPGEIHGKIRVIGARGVLISNLALRLGSPEDAGVTVEEGAAAHILGADISTDGWCGVWARDGSYVKLENNRISGHDDADEAGVCISSGSTGRGAGNVISGNASDLQIFQHGVFVGSGETIGDETSGGLRAFASRSSYLELRDDSVVWGDLQATLLSQVHIRATAVHGSARGFANSVIYVRRGATVDEVGCDPSSECVAP